MKPIFIVTGANGHLGNTLVRLLKQQNQEVRGLILPGEKAQNTPLVHYYHADVCKKESLRALFANTHMRDVYVIHTAGIVDISPKVLPKVYDVNVTGTQNVIDLCREYGVKRLVYVSSVHAIPEQGKNKITSEIQNFSPHNVVGGYAKTKAQATQAVLHACRQGLDAVVVQPSGILGPYDSSGNHLVQMVKDYLAGRLPACVKGGYDFVDVRDVALGCLQAAYKGKSGECYILSNRRYQIHEVLEMVRRYAGGKKLLELPMWMAKAFAPCMQWYAKHRHIRPLYTAYSLHTLDTGERFSHKKASRELGYHPRKLSLTIRDTVLWLKNPGMLQLA